MKKPEKIDVIALIPELDKMLFKLLLKHGVPAQIVEFNALYKVDAYQQTQKGV